MKHIKFILKYSAKNRIKLVIALACLSFVSLSNLIYPWLFKLMIDSLGAGDNNPGGLNIPLITGLFGGVILLSTVLGYFTNVLMQELGSELRNDVRSGFFSSLLNKPYIFFKDEPVGGLTSRATEDIGKLQAIFTGLVVPVYQNTLFILGCLVLMLMLNPAATGIVLAIILSGLPLMFYFSKKIKLLASESQKGHASANAVMDESLTGIREVKAFLLEKLRLGKYSDRSSSALEKEMQSSRYQAKSTQSVFMIVSLMLLVIFYLGTSKSSSGSWSPGSAVAFYFYAYSLTMAFLSLGRAYTSYNSISGATGRIVELIGNEELNAEAAAKGEIARLNGRVEFQNVSFGYGDKIVLNDVSFSAGAGDWLLITGPSGSGKSTIANLMLGFYTAQSGKVLYDGINMDSMNISDVRKNIGYVGQEAVLFEGTIRENILITGKEISEARLGEILRISMADKFIDQLPNGLDTKIAERGITLSAGQRSRIAIARALAIEPAILVLDEANSMLEEGLEAELWKNLYEARKDKTTIIFSHHTETIPEVYKHFKLQ
ncbi:MAG: ABC transporter ATP-binding protein [Ignavibacteria bacterium]|nr:ABC transporter ATP-binding protein/permease [Ignavibacteria bacterium]MCC7158562.1 ABC transporter ATP-binding protein [Ignavibacteria bacterium]